MKKLMFFAGICAINGFMFAQTVRYVVDGGVGFQTGTSWQDAYLICLRDCINSIFKHKRENIIRKNWSLLNKILIFYRRLNRVSINSI